MLLTHRGCSPHDDGGRPDELTAKHEDGDVATVPGSRKGRVGDAQAVRDTDARPRQRHTRSHADDEARCGRRLWVLRRLLHITTGHTWTRRRGDYAGALPSEWLRGGSGRGETMPTRLQ
jgi:hypothetical protein